MGDRATAQTAPSKIPSRTGLALLLFVTVMAATTAIVDWIYAPASRHHTSAG